MDSAAPVYNDQSAKHYLSNRRIPVLQHPLHSPYLAQCNFLLFRKINKALKGTHFRSVEEIKTKTAKLLKRGDNC